MLTDLNDQNRLDLMIRSQGIENRFDHDEPYNNQNWIVNIRIARNITQQAINMNSNLIHFLSREVFDFPGLNPLIFFFRRPVHRKIKSQLRALVPDDNLLQFIVAGMTHDLNSLDFYVTLATVKKAMITDNIWLHDLLKKIVHIGRLIRRFGSRLSSA
ncbi:MAG: hypothetical protein B6244_07755 [Candidatus Cloacimonetes bacterium 4572_55]|nr:MAG: hypothetical protein B6244_07755 [Candidatus Cloacimonetes bacterium 4572_55]